MQEASRFQTRLQSSRISSAVAYLSCSTNPNPIECLEVEFRAHHEPRRGFNQSWIPRPAAIACEFNALHQDFRVSLQRRRLRRCEIHNWSRGSAANVPRIASRGTSTVTPHSCTVRVSCSQLRRMVSVQKTVPRTRSNHKLAPSAHSAKPLQSSSNHVPLHDKAMPGSTRYPGSCGLPQGPAESSVPCYEGKPTRLISS